MSKKYRPFKLKELIEWAEQNGHYDDLFGVINVCVDLITIVEAQQKEIEELKKRLS